jgi:hypothetical protein
LGNSLCSALLILVCVSASRSLAAQSTTFAGTVVRVAGGDTLGVPNVPVLLHRVSEAAQGVIDSGRTDRSGRYRFRTRLETGASYLVSTDYAGIAFFTPPLSTDPARPDTGVKVVVADTSSGPAAHLTFTSRHLLVQGGDSAGWRGVLDVMVFENRSGYTRIAADTATPALVVLLPPDAFQPELADGDIGPEAVRFQDGALEVYAPFAPGEASLTVQYLLPATGSVAIPFGDTVASFNLLIDGEGAVAGGPRLDGPIPTEVEGRHFSRWSAPVPGGLVLQLDLRAARTTPTWLLAALVVAMATGLVTALVVAQRRGGVAKPVGAS